MNKVNLIGNLGDNPELRYTESGTAVCNMSLATNESYTDQDGNEVQRTEWHDIVAWDRLGEICGEYLEKGSQVYFEGKLQAREWEDRDENTRYSTEVKALDMMFLDSNRRGQRGGAVGAAAGALPDVLESLVSPHHRGFFHSMPFLTALVFAAALLFGRSKTALMRFLFSFLVGYGSHLLADGNTPQGLRS